MPILLRRCVAAAVAVLSVGAGHAALLEAPVASNAFIVHQGLQWAWASPVAADGSFGAGGVDLSYQGALGWRLPTVSELGFAPLATQFMFAGANVPLGGADEVSGSRFWAPIATLTGAAACAAAYFNATFTHCDWGNAPGATGTMVQPWSGQAGAKSFSESLVVRSTASGAAPPGISPVPEPTTYLLMALGVAGIALFRRITRR